MTADLAENHRRPPDRSGLLSRTGWTAAATSQETTGEPGQASRAVDNDPYTHWHSDHSAALPQQLSIDLGREQHISGIRYMPRQDGGTNGRVKVYEVLCPTTEPPGGRWQPAPSRTTAPSTSSRWPRSPRATSPRGH
ncbi:discoidin domain-containing protein [Streptomyces sp. NPDC055092]